MRKVLVLIVVLVSVLPSFARPNYKYILQHYDEFSTREALYRLREYQAWAPTEAHPYYLMGGIYYQLYRQEHPIHNYLELDNTLYNGMLFYGNCGHFIGESSIRKEWYADVAVGGKVDQQMIRTYVMARRDTLRDLRERLQLMHDSYVSLVTNYDTCRQLMMQLSERYAGEKQAHLMLDSADRALLSDLRDRSLRLPDQIRQYRQHLAGYPIAGYDPQFRWSRIDYFRMDGLTMTDFLQNDIPLWDYATWVDRFLLTQDSEYARYYRSLADEQQRLSAAMARPTAMRENKRLINTVSQLDPSSGMGALLHLEYQYASGVLLADRILSVDSLSSDSWLTCLQQLYRLQQLVADMQSARAWTQMGLSAEDMLKYADFLQTYFAEDRTTKQSASRWLTDADTRCREVGLTLAERGLTQGMDTLVQIDEHTAMVISADGCSPREWRP